MMTLDSLLAVIDEIENGKVNDGVVLIG